MSSAGGPLCDDIGDTGAAELEGYLAHAQHALELLADVWAELDHALPITGP